jgi:hypothetical protein
MPVACTSWSSGTTSSSSSRIGSSGGMRVNPMASSTAASVSNGIPTSSLTCR